MQIQDERHNTIPNEQRRIQDRDRASTGNLTKHAMKCWGKDVVKVQMKGVEAQGTDGSIFSAFARASEHPVAASDRTLTEAELRCLMHILSTGRPEYSLPRRRIVAWDLHAAYERSQEYVMNLLQEYPGRLSFGTDAWMSPNHRVFVPWIVHLQHEGELLSFPLDVYEVPEVRDPFQSILLILFSNIVLVAHRRGSCTGIR
ncbi:hypothetical protein B0H14DRAFT_2393192 [Mycena olivaceomarginata]|nr:hypothetical protein B0H14DRAFT_2393192 [Mycena olivaceomarginata]